MPAPRRRMAAEHFAQFKIVVDLAIEDDHELAACRMHRLMAGSRKIEHREPGMPQRDSTFRLCPQSRIVGSTVAKAANCHVKRVVAMWSPAPSSDDAAHDRCLWPIRQDHHSGQSPAEALADPASSADLANPANRWRLSLPSLKPM